MNARQPRRTIALTIIAGSFLALATLAWAALPVAAAPASVQLGIRTSPTLGMYLTGPDGHALYTLSSEPMNGVRCVGGCLYSWPPLVLAAGGTVHGPAGAIGTFGTFVRSDTRATQAAHNGHALYYFYGDASASDTHGEGIIALGGVWHVAHVALGAPTYEAVAGNVATGTAATALQAKVTRAGLLGFKVEHEATGTAHYQVEHPYSTKAAAVTAVTRLKSAKYPAVLETDPAGSV
jgi:predicted lipoprotein with Yx(FWY)xxD motif